MNKRLKNKLIAKYTKQVPQGDYDENDYREYFAANNEYMVKPNLKPVNTNFTKREASDSITDYLIQVASTTTKEDAYRISGKLRNYTSKIEQVSVGNNSYYRVRAIGFENKSNAQLALNSIRSKGFKDAYILKKK